MAGYNTFSTTKKDIVKKLDMPLSIYTLIAVIWGIIMIASASSSPVKHVAVQTVASCLGLVGIFMIIIWDYEYLAGISKYLYLGSVFLLTIVLIPGIGSMVNGARSWFRIGSLFSIQPAEIAKLFFIITFSNLLSKREDLIDEPKNVIAFLLHLAIPIVLILLQPDMGTATVFFFIFFVLLFVAGISWKYILGALGTLVPVIPVLWFFVLKDYQKLRIVNLFHPENDPSGSGYHVVQSKITIGSGQLTGTGLFNGASQYNNFLPERHTDFIFSVICEELGLIGGLLCIALLIAIIVRCIQIGLNSKNSLGKYICLGVAAMFTFHVFENIGMCIGIMPVTGIPLPFFTYGGSSILTNLIAIGLVLNVDYRSKQINI
ncbi:MAG: rod shape-determining protein RodA [Clostridia bacterium]|nr:rod shape-determining protein RodA [Clostridia bacterium]